MAIVFFPCLDQADTIDVTFAKLQGGDATLRLLVDSGFNEDGVSRHGNHFKIAP